mgnify:CR=1 FL=1
MRNDPSSQLDALKLLYEGLAYITSNAGIQKGISALWSVWRLSQLNSTDKCTFGEFVTKYASEFDDLAACLLACDRFSVPTSNKIDSFLGTMPISRAFAFLSKTEHQSNTLRKIAKSLIAREATITDMFGPVAAESTDENRKVA